MGNQTYGNKVGASVLSLTLVAGGLLLSPHSASAADRINPMHAATAAQVDMGRNTLFGSTVQAWRGGSMRDAMKRTNRKYRGVETVRAFHRGLPESWRELRAVYGKKKLVVSFKADPTAITSGRHDRFFTRWFRHAPTNRRTFWTYYHEPEDNIEAGQFTAREYRAAWRHLSDLAARAHNRKLKATMILMGWTLDPMSGRHWKRYYVPRAMEILGWDVYNRKNDEGWYLSARKLFKRIVRIDRRNKRPFAIAEFGSALAKGDSGKRRARWLRRSGRFLEKHNAVFVSYFDATVDGGDYRLLDRPSRRSWRHVVNKKW